MAVTVLETIQRSTEFLARKRVDSPRLQAELLLAHVLRLPRMRLYLNFEQKLNPSELDQLRVLVKRRSQREPLQHILGGVCFCGVDLVVSRAALVPRPETELLAELGWNFLQSLPRATLADGPGAVSVLDFGTGTGCLAIALAVKCPSAVVYALDVSAEALALAAQNAARHGLTDRIHFVLGEGLDALPPDLRFDLLISNPPYIPTAEIERLQPEVRDFDPRQALDGGADGLTYYRLLAAQAQPQLRPGGKLMLEFGDSQAESVRKLLLQENWIVERVVQDYTQRPRIVIAQKPFERQTAAQQPGDGSCSN